MKLLFCNSLISFYHLMRIHHSIRLWNSLSHKKKTLKIVINVKSLADLFFLHRLNFINDFLGTLVMAAFEISRKFYGNLDSIRDCAIPIR
jgi:hypothetical protein